MECYDAGHRVFGENYVQEIVEKAPAMPADVSWRFIGHLQSNKVRALVTGVPGLAAIETVDSAKLANKLNNAVKELERAPLGVMVQVNTSGEESKHGVEPGAAVVDLAKIVRDAEHLRFEGLMTIGMPDYTSRPENFECLRKCREGVRRARLDVNAVELSMGMSGDFEAAGDGATRSGSGRASSARGTTPRSEGKGSS